MQSMLLQTLRILYAKLSSTLITFYKWKTGVCSTLLHFASSIHKLDKIGFVKENFQTIASSQTPPWQVMEPVVNLTLAQYKTEDTNPLIYQSFF